MFNGYEHARAPTLCPCTHLRSRHEENVLEYVVERELTFLENHLVTLNLSGNQGGGVVCGLVGYWQMFLVRADLEMHKPAKNVETGGGSKGDTEKGIKKHLIEVEDVADDLEQHAAARTQGLHIFGLLRIERGGR